MTKPISDVKVESLDQLVQQFIISFNGCGIQVGELLSVIIDLGNSKSQQGICICNPIIVDYLKSKSLIEQVSRFGYKVADGKCTQLRQLGNIVSTEVDNRLETLPPNTVISLGPNIFSKA